MSPAEIFGIERVRGVSIGATIVAGFGALWLALGMAAANVPTLVAIAIVTPVFALIASLGLGLRRRLPKLLHAETPEKKQMMRAFVVVNVVQWVAILGTINLLRNLRLEGWIVFGNRADCRSAFPAAGPNLWSASACRHRYSHDVVRGCGHRAADIHA